MVTEQGHERVARSKAEEAFQDSGGIGASVYIIPKGDDLVVGAGADHGQ
jgi:hypothetical protein